MKRAKHWESKLAELIKAAYEKDFAYGTFDCCLFAADTVLALTGVDLAASFRGKYDSEETANAFIASFGDIGSLVSAAIQASQNSMQELSPKFAGRGDMVLVTNQGRQALGIVGLDGRFALCAAPKGLTSVPMANWLCGWKV
jgi:hypothetical protein